MTSTIGIPIKLLNEAQVGLLMLANFHHMALHKQNEHLCSKKCPRKLTIWAQNHVVSLELTSGQVFRGKLIEGIAFQPANIPPHFASHPSSITQRTKYTSSRRQHERPTERYHGRRPRWPR